MQQTYFCMRIKTLFGRLGLAHAELLDDSCTIRLDTLSIHLLGRAHRWVVLYGEIGALPQPTDAALLLRLLAGNLRPADGPACVLAVEQGTRQLVLWCQVDFTACDDQEMFDAFKRFMADAEDAHALLCTAGACGMTAANGEDRQTDAAPAAFVAAAVGTEPPGAKAHRVMPQFSPSTRRV
jgi:hypothetical protein